MGRSAIIGDDDVSDTSQAHYPVSQSSGRGLYPQLGVRAHRAGPCDSQSVPHHISVWEGPASRLDRAGWRRAGVITAQGAPGMRSAPGPLGSFEARDGPTFESTILRFVL